MKAGVILLLFGYAAVVLAQRQGNRGNNRRNNRGRLTSNLNVRLPDFNRMQSNINNLLTNLQNVDFANGGRLDKDFFKTFVDAAKQSAARRNANSRAGRREFANVDNAVRGNRREQAVRSIRAGAVSNEFVSSESAKQQALLNEDTTAQLVEKGGLNTAANFDADGGPKSQAAAQVVETVADAAAESGGSTCIFNKANSQPCTEKFREPTARCANEEAGKRTWGMAGTAYTRVLPAQYEDGISEMKSTEFTSSKKMPSPRRVSTAVFDTDIFLDRTGPSAMVMQWGQFIAHEFTLIGEIEENVECCADKVFEIRFGNSTQPTKQQLETIKEEIADVRAHVCIPIYLDNDPVFNKDICIQATRSTPSPLHDCAIGGPRQQMNLITHVFDASAIYGSSKQEVDALRSGRDGLMKTQVVNGKQLLPVQSSACPASKQTSAEKCPFMAGDKRVNATPNLASFHTVFVVLHNKIASALKVINAHWDDDRLYQESRRIVSGLQSSVHFYEWLPEIIGSSMIQKYELNSYNGFKNDVNPSVLNEMAGAAFRFGHSLIDGFISAGENFLDLQKMFFNHTVVYNQGPQDFLNGLLKDIPWITDFHYPAQMRDNLFNKINDVVSLNVNRGRDHGFASYMAYRRHYGLSTPTSWEDLLRTHSAAARDSLKKVYTTVEDIELYPGGVTEKHVTGGRVGELFANIIGDGHRRLRDGDRFYFENSEGSGLNQDQINVLKSVKLNEILCIGGDLTSVSSEAFFTRNKAGVTIKQCSELVNAVHLHLNLALWREQNIPDECNAKWRRVDVSDCCFGSKTITRVCEGETPTCKCQGEAKITERCRCHPRDYRCFVRSFNFNKCSRNRWSFIGSF